MTSDQVFALFSENFSRFSTLAQSRLEGNNEYARNEQLCHYTSLSAVEKIIETKSLISTSIFMMNDPNELTFGYEHLTRYLPDVIVSLLKTYSQYRSAFGFPAFAFCMTELDDDMYHWDKYGDKHRGIRIGFTPEKITEYWKSIEGNVVYLAPVIYLTEDGKFSGDYWEEFQDFWTLFVGSTVREHLGGHLDPDGISALSYCIAIASSLLKKREWATEREWRIVSICSGYVADHIRGSFTQTGPTVKLVCSSENTLDFLTNRGHDGEASKDVLKIGSLAGDVEYVEYVVKLLMKRATGVNFFEDAISKSSIQTR